MAEPFFGNCSLLAPDLFGFGESSKPDEWDYSLSSHAVAIEQLLEQLDIDQVHIIGHSLGGMIGTLLLKSCAGKILSLVSLEGNLTLEDCGASREVSELSFENFSSDYFPKFKSRLEISAEPSAPFRLAALSQVSDLAYSRTSKGIVKYAATGELKHLFEHVPSRKMLMRGAKSSFQSRVSSMWSSDKVISGAGHFLIHDNYSDVVVELRAFLGDIGQGG